MLRATDRQVLDLRACMFTNGVNVDRRVRRDTHVGGSEMVALPDPVGPVTFTLTGDRLEATPSSLPDHDKVFLYRQSDVVGTGINAHGIVVSRTFREASGAATVTLDFSDVPGFRPSWRIDSATQHVGFEASRGTSTDGMMTASSVFRAATATEIRSGLGRRRAALRPDDPVGFLGE
jgi:hypothetical protein